MEDRVVNELGGCLAPFEGKRTAERYAFLLSVNSSHAQARALRMISR